MKWIINFCENHKIPYIPMDKAIENIEYNKLWVHIKDHHPNAFAHKLFAQFIHRYLKIKNGKIFITYPIIIQK